MKAVKKLTESSEFINLQNKQMMIETLTNEHQLIKIEHIACFSTS